MNIYNSNLNSNSDYILGTTMAKLKNKQREKDFEKRKILKEVYRLASLKIIEASKYSKNYCIFTVPYIIPGYNMADIDMEELTIWLIKCLQKENFIVHSIYNLVIDIDIGNKRIGAINDILIYWDIKTDDVYDSKITI